MGFDDGKIVLDSPNRTYYTGQTVRGNLIFDQNKVKTFRGIYVKFVGFCKVYWTTTETRRVNDKYGTYTVVHESYEEYFNVKTYLVGDKYGDHHIQPGHYDYSFNFQIPSNCPSSFEGEYGRIRYEIEAVVDKAFNFDQKKKVGLRVIAPLDLNMNPYCKEPLEMKLNGTYYCCCFSSGSTDTVVNAPLSGYCPGQKICIEITSANKGIVEIKYIKLRIKQRFSNVRTGIFSIVLTKEGSSHLISVVPSTWVNNNDSVLFWPRKRKNSDLEQLRRNGKSVPSENWRKLKCVVKVKGIATFAEGIRLEELYSNFEDTEDEESSEVKIINLKKKKIETEKKTATENEDPSSNNLETIIIHTSDKEILDEEINEGLQDGIDDKENKIDDTPDTKNRSIIASKTVTVLSDVKINNKTIDSKHETKMMNRTHFIATNEPDIRTTKDIVAEIKKGPILGNTTRNWTVEMEVPALNGYNLTGCRYISATYKLEVVVSPEGCHSNSHQSRQIIIGTIPLVGFQDDVVNPLQNQMPQQVAPITQQPLFSNVTSPYPDYNAPYPNNQNLPYPVTSYHHTLNSNPPYPTNNSFKSPDDTDNTPYPPANQPYTPNDASKLPYSSANPPYPVNTPGTITNPPYPVNTPGIVTNLPYPVNTPGIVTNPPYPVNTPGTVRNLPYPVNTPGIIPNPPYPVNTPDIVTNPPYPINDAVKSPFPSANSRYHGETSSAGANQPNPYVTPYHDYPPPYPANSSPDLAQMSYNQMMALPTLGKENVLGGKLLKTGNIGFIVQGGSNGVSNMPYPGTTTPLLALPSPINPYVSASAPVLDSPDIEKKE